MTLPELTHTLRSAAWTRPDGTKVEATWRAELALALGPQTMGQPGDGSFTALHSVPWMIQWVKNGELHLYQQQGDTWVEVQPGQAFPVLPNTARRLSLTFDQSARHVIAWEESGQIFVRQWDDTQQQYVYRGAFAGVDPVILSDATVMYQPEFSDTLLVYLNSARTELRYRLQRDAYTIERTLHTGLVNGVLDQVVALPYRLEILGESAGQSFALQSTLYPVPAADTLAAGGQLTAGEYLLMLYESFATDALAASGKILGGLYETTETKAVLTEPLIVTATFLNTSKFELVTVPRTASDALSASGALASTSKLEEVGRPSSLSEALAATGSFIGGSYAP